MHEVRVTLVPVLVVLGAACGLALLAARPRRRHGARRPSCSAVAFIAGTPLRAVDGHRRAGGRGRCGRSCCGRRSDRWTAFLDLAAHKQDDGFQVWQSLVGIASGGLTGVGLGASKAKWGYLPEAHTDFIFAIIAEELGFAGVAIVLFLFLVLTWLGVRVAARAPDRFGTLLAGGITAWIVCQTLINVGGVVGLMPLTGLTLPFVSFGGSSLLVSLAAAGLLHEHRPRQPVSEALSVVTNGAPDGGLAAFDVRGDRRRRHGRSRAARARRRRGAGGAGPRPVDAAVRRGAAGRWRRRWCPRPASASGCSRSRASGARRASPT